MSLEQVAAAPYLLKTKAASQLIVKGKPFLMLAAELQNSTFSNAAYMSKIWPALKGMHVNTVLSAVSWQMIEPVEGVFDFRELDKCILGAREHGLHLVLLWFGGYKNTLCTYTPDWVKTDAKRFPRLHIRKPGDKLETVEVLQPRNEATWKADSRAFAALMKHLKQFDGDHSTVIMMQVQNEIGLLGDSRDGSAISNRLFNSPVPADLLSYLYNEYQNLHPTFRLKFPDLNTKSPKDQPTWPEAFGSNPFAEDLFMADGFSRYVQKVASAGRAEYDIPLFANAALCSEEPSWLDWTDIPENVPEGDTPGEYPSGGPIGHNMDVWKFNAPDIQFYAPDIYLQDYDTICDCFRYKNQPLFIPEQRRDEYGARRVWSAYANYLALGCSPFGIDTLTPEASPISRHYRLLHLVRDHILEAQAERPGDLFGFYFDEIGEGKGDRQWIKSFGDFEVTIQRAFVFGKQSAGAGMVIRLPDHNFLVVGYGFELVFKSTDPESTFTGILRSEEIEADEADELHTARIFNGDETSHGRCIVLPSENPDYGDFPIPFQIPARTMMVKCKPYSLAERPEDF